MSKKLIAIATADWHLHNFNNFNTNRSRLKWAIKAAERIMRIAKKYDVPILFAGDLLHNPKEVENFTNEKVQQLFNKLKVPFFGISGNHDMSERNSKDHKSPSHLGALLDYKNFYRISGGFTSKFGYTFGGDAAVWGIDYMNNDKDLFQFVMELKPHVKSSHRRIKILLVHSDAPGAITPTGFRVNETQNIPKDLDKFFEEWDLVLFGHIHKPQKLSNKCYMLGSPIHQDESNEGCKMGYWKVYDDASMQFVHMSKFPKFIRLKPGEKAPDNLNYYIKPGEVLAEESIENGEFNIKHSKSKLAKQYLALKAIKKKSYKRALVDILNQTE